MRRALIAAAIVLLLSACGTPGPLPSPDGASPITQTSSVQPSPTRAALVPESRQPLVIGIDDPITSLSKGSDERSTIDAVRLVYSTLFRLDEELLPVPDLAAAPCETADAQTWTCRLKEARFHDGTPLNAEDVVFTFELSATEICLFRSPVCIGGVISSVHALDARTVEFRLVEPYSPFAARVLSEVAIESREVIETAFEELSAAVADIGLDQVRTLSADIYAAETAAPARCSELINLAEQLLAETEIDVRPRTDPGLPADPCEQALELAARLDRLVASQETDGIQAIVSVYRLLPFNNRPVGTGPFRCDANCLHSDGSVVLTAYEGYHGGPPATSAVEFHVNTRTPASEAVAVGDMDWLPSLAADDPAALGDDPRVQLAEYPELGYLALQYNVREGALFADQNLRKAMQLCIDMHATVDAATHGGGIAVNSPIAPSSWAHHPDLPDVERDVEAAKALIEDSGWSLGEDGVYVASDGRRLSTRAYLRLGAQERYEFMRRVVDQVSECGIEIELTEMHVPVINILVYPHSAANDSKPFDLYFGGWSDQTDPDLFPYFHSSQCTTEEEPATFNYVCYQNPRLDRLIEEGRATTETTRRRDLYRGIQEILAEEQPYLFAWVPVQREALDVNLRSTAGELTLSSPTWDWQPETLFVDD